jgi:drug/metabolite transporter (DMT)-like permease
VSKLALADRPPLLLVTIRLLVAGVITLGIATMLGAKRRLGWRDGLVLAALGVVNSASYLSFSHLGMRLVPAGLMAPIVSTNPVLTALLAASFLGERMTVRKITGLMLGVAGVAIVVESRLAGGTSSALGIGFAVAALLSMGHAAFISQGVSGVFQWHGDGFYRHVPARSFFAGINHSQRSPRRALSSPVLAIRSAFGAKRKLIGRKKLANSVANDPNETRLPQNRCCARLPLNRFRRA